jgi:hypothetical protein
LGLGALLAPVLIAEPAHAQNPAAAEALFEQARAAMSEGKYDIACARFRDSDKLDPAVGTRLNLGDCEEHRGHIATAWSLFRGVVSELNVDDDRRPIAEKRAKALESRLPYVTLVRTPQTPAGVHVKVDGVELGEGSFGLALPMDPGQHSLSLTVEDGGEPRTRTFELREQQRLDVPLRWRAHSAKAEKVTLAETPETPESPAAPASDHARASGSNQQTWGVVVGGLGAAGLVLGGVAGVTTLHQKSIVDHNCNDATHTCNQAGFDANDKGRKYGMLTTIGLGVGLVGIAAGAYLYASAPPTREAHLVPPKRRFPVVSASFGLAPGTGFVVASGSF